ncbi:hypothetical protein Tco_0109995 [Tanacetum coccineum]
MAKHMQFLKGRIGVKSIRWQKIIFLAPDLQDEMKHILHWLENSYQIGEGKPSLRSTKLFWNTLTHDAKTGFIAFKLDEKCLTEAEEEVVAREVHATHARIVSESEPEPTQRWTSGKCYSEILGGYCVKERGLLNRLRSSRVYQTLSPAKTKGADIIKLLNKQENEPRDSLELEAHMKGKKKLGKAHEALAGPDPKPMKEDQTGSDSENYKCPLVERGGDKTDECSLKVLETTHCRLIEKNSVCPGPESIQNHESERFLNEIIRIKREQWENPANYHLYQALMEALIADEDAMDKEVKERVKNHKRKHDSDDDDEDDDDDEGPSAGSNQGKSTKRRRHDSGASGSAQPPTKDDEQSSKKPRKSDASASKQHPALPSTGWKITDTRDADVDSSMHRFDPESEQSKQSSDNIPGYISSGLVQNSVSPTPYVPPSKKDYEILAVDPVGSPSSTTIDQDEQSTSTSPTNQEIQSQVTHQGPVPQLIAPDHSSSGPVLHEMMSDHNSSDLAPQRQEMSCKNVSSRPRSQGQKASEYDTPDPRAPKDKKCFSYTAENDGYRHNKGWNFSSVL